MKKLKNVDKVIYNYKIFNKITKMKKKQINLSILIFIIFLLGLIGDWFGIDVWVFIGIFELIAICVGLIYEQRIRMLNEFKYLY